MNYVYIVLYHSLQDGATPLILASHNGHKDIVEVLLNHGAEVDLPNKVSVRISYHYLVDQLSVILEYVLPVRSVNMYTLFCSIHYRMVPPHSFLLARKDTRT